MNIGTKRTEYDKDESGLVFYNISSDTGLQYHVASDKRVKFKEEPDIILDTG